MAAIPVTTVIGDALAELNVFGPGAVIPAQQATFCLGKLNRIFDNWNAKHEATWCDIFTEFTFTPNLTPHTIGPTGTWTMTIRPVSIDGYSLNVNTSTPNLYIPIVPVDKDEYSRISQPGLQVAYPKYVYYEKDWPNGKLFFYPVPSTDYRARLLTRTLLASVSLASSIDFPPGYQDAVTLTLAEDIAAPFGRAIPQQIKDGAADARALIFNNNIEVPVINTRGSGMQRAGTGKMSNFNYRSRTFN